MAIRIRDVRDADLDAVLELNNTAGPGILPISRSRMQALRAAADYFRVAEVDGQLAGFLIAMGPTAAYDSPNFLWFRERYPAFLYIDRVVVAAPFRGHGIGRVFYADVLSFAEVRYPLLTCEVFLEPRDDVALLFHGTRGFQEVGRQRINDGRYMVSLLAKELPSFDYVRERYLEAADADWPDLGWTPPHPRRSGRSRPAEPSQA